MGNNGFTQGSYCKDRSELFTNEKKPNIAGHCSSFSEKGSSHAPVILGNGWWAPRGPIHLWLGPPWSPIWVQPDGWSWSMIGWIRKLFDQRTAYWTWSIAPFIFKGKISHPLFSRLPMPLPLIENCRGGWELFGCYLCMQKQISHYPWEGVKEKIWQWFPISIIFIDTWMRIGLFIWFGALWKMTTQISDHSP